MEKMTKDMIQKRQLAIWERMDCIDEQAKKENREFTDAEAKEYEALIRESKGLSARAEAMASGKALDVDGVKQLASIPSREVLLSQLCGLLMSPISRTAVVLGALAKKKSEGEAAAAA